MRKYICLAIVGFAPAFLLADGDPAITLPATLPVTRPTESATLGDAQMAFEQGNYREALRKIAIALPMAIPNKANGDGRYDLLTLRGETLLRMKERSLAIDAFSAASRATADVKKVAAAEGTVMVLKASPTLAFKPTGALPGEEVDVIDPVSRQKALTLLYDQDRSELQQKVTAALTEPTLTPTQDLLPALQDLYSIETAATGQAVQTTDLAAKLGDHAKQLIGKELVRLNRRFDDLENLASQLDFADNNGVYARGLYSNEQNEIKDDITYLQRIKAVTDRGRRIARELGRPTDEWEALGDATDDAVTHGQWALERRS